MTGKPGIANATFKGPGPDAVFRQGLAEGRFLIQHCPACGQYVFYPRSLCPKCGSPEPNAVEANGRGRVYSTTVDRRRPEAGGPVNVALIDLAEGPRLMSRVIGVESGEVTIGMAVFAEIHEEGGEPIVLFRPSGAG